jgi:hypothetical protein
MTYGTVKINVARQWAQAHRHSEQLMTLAVATDRLPPGCSAARQTRWGKVPLTAAPVGPDA